MKKSGLGFSLVVLLLVCGQAEAAQGRKVQKKALPQSSSPTEVQQPSDQQDQYQFQKLPTQSYTGRTRVGLGAPVMLLEGEAFWGADLFVLHGVSPNWEIGGETGFHIWSKSVGSVSATAWVIPVLPTAIYNFDVDSKSFSPFLGVGLGVGVAHVGLSIGSISASGTKALFEGLAHVGAKFGESKNFFIDMKLGILDSSFVFLPSIGLNF